MLVTAENIRLAIEQDLTEKGFFLVDIQVRPSGKILVYADCLKGISLDDCATISRMIMHKMGSDIDDFELEVSSPGIDNPLKLPVQYRKNIGRTLRVVKTAGETNEGIIISADNEKVTLEANVAIKQKGKKETEKKVIEIYYSEIKTAKIII
jgi:ribosome maturation factor RimP